ncbi:hypothetical protein ACFLVE_02710, partial [Chloroflexota bacterium]
CRGILDRPAIEETLGISKSTFFVLLREYRHNSDEFSLSYHRETPTRIPARVEKEIEKELLLQKNLLNDSTLPITTYNYSAIRDRLAGQGIVVALSTIIDRAKSLDCYQAIPRDWNHLAEDVDRSAEEMKTSGIRLGNRRAERAADGEHVGSPVCPGYIVPIKERGRV